MPQNNGFVAPHQLELLKTNVIWYLIITFVPLRRMRKI